MNYRQFLPLFLICCMPLVAQAASPTGLWMTKKQDFAVRINPCADGLCGYIAWLSPSVKQTDAQGRPLCREKVLSGFRPDATDPNLWTGGTIFRADDGKTYQGEIHMLSDQKMELRGYIGIAALGKDKKLTRTDEQTHPVCTP